MRRCEENFIIRCCMVVKYKNSVNKQNKMEGGDCIDNFKNRI